METHKYIVARRQVEFSNVGAGSCVQECPSLLADHVPASKASGHVRKLV